MPFPKGQSGNPSGRKAKTKPLLEVEYLARAVSPEAIERLTYWMRQDDPRASVAACNALLDRGHGKPQQTVAATITDERSVIRAPETAETVPDWQSAYKPH